MTIWTTYRCPSCGATVSVRARSTATVETCSHTGRRALKPTVMVPVTLDDQEET
jgi:DNA-directed RNA polymerase subunit RPC12/RpoP